VIFTGIATLLSVSLCLVTCPLPLRSSHQAVEDVSTSQGALFNLFDRIENFFRRLEAYVELQLTAQMTDVIVKVMLEVLLIIGLATKEIKRGKTSEFLASDSAYSTYFSSERFLRKLRGRSDIEDALRRLDSLTQEEHRMAIAQSLRSTQHVDERMYGIGNNIIEYRMAAAQDLVATAARRTQADAVVMSIHSDMRVVDERACDVEEVRGVRMTRDVGAMLRDLETVRKGDDRGGVVDDKPSVVTGSTHFLFASSRPPSINRLGE
jgi:hypothetical protein